VELIMTDTGPPAELEDVVVTGQRRPPESLAPFPQRPQPATWPGEHAELPPNIEGDVPDPCADPATALEWNADAAAAEAKRKFLVRASELGDDELYQREFHAFLYRDSNGRIQVGEVSFGNRVGPTQPSTADPNWTGITPDNIIGEIHNHPGGGVAPGGDWERFDGITSWISQFAGSQRASEYRHYIIAGGVIRVYDATSPRNNNPGPEVNPQGQPCP
jgi:hypothetical protein